MANEKITYSSELMQNYKQAEVMSPEQSLVALQSNTGTSVLFSIGTNNAFYATVETVAHKSGWQKYDLSSSILQQYPATASPVCSHFSAAQNEQDGTIGLAMVVHTTQGDELYLCLGNSNSNLEWLAKPKWVSFSYDNPTSPRPSVTITNVFLSETLNGQFIVVDILRQDPNPGNLIARYYIDTSKSGGYAWHPHSLTIDLSQNNYYSCIGRKEGQPIDGIYTCGTVNGHPQFIYLPLYNPFNPLLPSNPDRLFLPNNVVPQAIASCRNPSQSTDLFVVGNNTLYYFASTNQMDGAQGEQLVTHGLLQNVSNLFAFRYDSQIYIWGKNQDDQIFYLTCPLAQLTISTAWSTPLVLLAGVEQVAPYINRVNGGNTFFAHTGVNELKKAVKSTVTTLWTFTDILLPPLHSKVPAIKSSSYTTRIIVSDADNAPLVNFKLNISAESWTAVYINNLYYILSETPIQIATDALGSITITQFVNNLNSAKLTIAASNLPNLVINPSDAPVSKLGSLDSSQKLEQAQIKSWNGTSRPLVSGATSATDLDAVAKNNANLAVAFASLNKQKIAATAPPVTSRKSGNRFIVEVGDLFRTLETGIQHAIDFIKDAATGFWHMVVTIGSEVYSAVLDDVHKIVGAFKWLFNKIKVAIEDLIHFLEYLFEWADITRTKEVIKQITHVYGKHLISELQNLKGEFDTAMKSCISSVNNWSGISNFSGLGTAASDTTTKKAQPNYGLDAPNTMLLHHFKNNASQFSFQNGAITANTANSAQNDLINCLEKEGSILSATLNELGDIAKSFTSMSLEAVLKKLIATFADTVLLSAQNVIDTFFELLVGIGQAFLDLLEAPIYIPVISDILKDFGVPSISFLDLLSWIAAIPITIIYKIAHNHAPFEDNAETTFLKTVTSFSDLQSACTPVGAKSASSQAPQTSTMALRAVPAAVTGNAGTTASTQQTGSTVPVIGKDINALSAGTKSVIFTTMHLTCGFSYLCLAYLDPEEALDPESSLGVPIGVISFIGGAADVTALVLVPEASNNIKILFWLDKALIGLHFLNKAIFGGFTQKFVAKKIPKLGIEGSRQIYATIDSILCVIRLIPTCVHFDQLSKMGPSLNQSAGILQECYNLSYYITRFSYATAVTNDDPIVQAVAAGVLCAADLGCAGLQISESLIAIQPS